MLLILSDIPLRTAPFSLADQWLIWTELRLYADRLELSGWGVRGRYWRCLPFEEIETVDHERDRLLLSLTGSRVLPIHMNHPRRWHTAIEPHRSVYER